MLVKQHMLLIVLLGMLLQGLSAQDPVVSHFYANGSGMNPAWAGIEGPARVFIGYRNQWPNSGSSYVTYQAAYDQYVERLHGGIGVNVMNDLQGDQIFSNYQLGVSYAYHFQATRKLFLSGGLRAAVGHQSFNPGDQLVFGDMYDPFTGGQVETSERINGYSEFYPDFAAGAAFFYRSLYGGIAMHHITRPVITDKSDPTGFIPRKYAVHLGAMIPIIERDKGRKIMTLSPNLVFMQQQNIQQINYGLEVICRELLGGVWFRHDMIFNYGNIIFSVGYGNDTFRFRYSYDVTLSGPDVTLPHMGAHEFSLVISYDQVFKRKTNRAIKCPKI